MSRLLQRHQQRRRLGRRGEPDAEASPHEVGDGLTEELVQLGELDDGLLDGRERPLQEAVLAAPTGSSGERAARL